MNRIVIFQYFHSEKQYRVMTRCLITLILVCLFCSSFSVSAVPIPYGQPYYSATLTGSNELEPGNETLINIKISNIGHTPEKILDIEDPVPSSPVVGVGAELILEPGTAPVDIIATPLTIPALIPSDVVHVAFPVIVPADAKEGSYTLNLHVNSQYAESVAMQGSSNIFTYKPYNTTLPIPVTIKKVVRVRVDDITSSNLSPGLNGKITANITNIGQYAGVHATAELISGTSSLLLPYQGSYYLGTFAQGEERIVEWKAAIHDNADESILPATLVISYEDKNGKQTTSMPVSIGIPIQKGPKFLLEYDEPIIEPGGQVNVRVTYLNTGDTPAYDATAKIVPIDPVSSPQTGIILGTILPGESADADYRFNLESSALVKKYGVLTDVKYRGEDGLIAISDPMRIEITTKEQGILSMLLSPVSLVIILGIVIIAGYLFIEREERLIK